MNKLNVKIDKAVKEKISDIWAKVLNHNDIQDEDNFFGIGGDSMSAIEVLTIIQDEFSVKVPLSVLFQHKRLGDFSNVFTRKYQNAFGEFIEE